MTDKATQVRQTVRKEVQPLLSTVLDTAHTYAEVSRKLVGLQHQESKADNAEEYVHDKDGDTKEKANGSVRRKVTSDSQDWDDKSTD
jgi:hypothetical protein